MPPEISERDLHEWADVSEQNVLVLNYTMTCPLSCNFCCYGCHPGRTEKMPIEQAMRLIREAADLKHISSVAFTGGEVFFYQDELITLSELLCEVGLPFTVATAGHWGNSAERAKELGRILVENGLRRANISTDDAHAEFVPRESAITAASALADLNIPVYVVSTFPDASRTAESFVPELVGHKNIRLITKRVAKVGRARKFTHDNSDAWGNRIPRTCYRRVYHDIVVFYDGKTYPCCSTFNRATAGLTLGNAFEEPLSVIFSRLESSTLLRLLKRQGFERLYEIIGEYAPELLQGLPKITDFDGPCSLCNSLFSKTAEVERLLEVIALYETDQLMLIAENIRMKFGEDIIARCLDRQLLAQ